MCGKEKYLYMFASMGFPSAQLSPCSLPCQDHAARSVCAVRVFSSNACVIRYQSSLSGKLGPGMGTSQSMDSWLRSTARLCVWFLRAKGAGVRRALRGLTSALWLGEDAAV